MGTQIKKDRQATLRQVLLMTASVAMIITGMGARCPNGGGKASFQNTKFNTSTTVVFTRSWQDPMIVDYGAVDFTSADINLDQNVEYSAGVASPFSMASFFDIDDGFNMFFTRAISTVYPTSVKIFGFNQSDITSGTWVTGYSQFTDLTSSATDYEAMKPLIAKDADGNVMLAYMFRDDIGVPGFQLPHAVYKSAYSSWGVPVNITGGVAATSDNVESFAIDADYYGNFTVVWRENSHAYYNQYRPGLGWRYSSASVPVTWNHTADNTFVLALGMDVAFDESSGDGYGAYVSSQGGNHIEVARWHGDTVANWDTAVAGDFANISVAPATLFGYPKLVVTTSGKAAVLFYADDNGASAMLYASVLTSASAHTWSAAARIDTLAGSSDTTDMVTYNSGGGALVTPPEVAQNGEYAAVGFVREDDSGVSRFYVLSFNASTGAWTSLGAADLGSYSVNYGSLAIASDGTVIVAYSGTAVDGLEHVYGNVYSSGVWQGATQLDSSTDLGPIAITARSVSLPRVEIDSSGNAVVTYTMLNALTGTMTTQARRVVVVTYR